jgi:hypothetical protein
LALNRIRSTPLLDPMECNWGAKVATLKHAAETRDFVGAKHGRSRSEHVVSPDWVIVTYFVPTFQSK